MGAGYPNRRAAFRHLTSRGLKIWGTEWDADTALAFLVQMEGKRISTEDTVRIFNAATINLNLHSSVHMGNPVSGGDFVNPRTFEIAACRAFQLVDTRLLMGEMFEADEMATFNSIEELQEKISFFATRPEERAGFAERGYARVLKEHTYVTRMRTLLNFVEERLNCPVIRKSISDWPAAMSAAMRDDLQQLFAAMNLPSGAAFGDVVTAVREKTGTLTPLETAVLFLDEWQKQYISR